ncbi:uncharacterized protein [Gossypium hirsutum]|uniref:Uncharacterized protein n=1 Tax=Gossypium hirsutum TaxID=3635 RepID=A0ABM2ZP82_GOSHI|nr:uncharacterized protein LOC121214646 [Gossypium hirsutum]
MFYGTKSDVLTSPGGTFNASFRLVGDNAYSFAIWFSKPSYNATANNCTVAWMANWDQLVNGRCSKLCILRFELEQNLRQEDVVNNDGVEEGKKEQKSVVKEYKPQVLHPNVLKRDQSYEQYGAINKQEEDRRLVDCGAQRSLLGHSPK